MAPIRTLLPALGLLLLQAGQAHARAQGYTGADHPFKTDPVYDPYFTFGEERPISKDGGHSIPHFEVIGHPEILSDRVILTPPQPGNQRAAIWSDHSNHNADWEIHVPFRASGPERAQGSLQIWYTLRGASATGTSTIYTAKPFEGFALVIDSFGGTGTIRGFLNDGSLDYSIHHHPQSLAFGQCVANYRNLGRLSDLKISYRTQTGLKVEFDNHLCFESDKVQLPQKYRFGISAVSAENPDSFEVFGFKVATKGKVEQQNDKQPEEHQNDPSKQQRITEEEQRQQRLKEAADHHIRMAGDKHAEYKSQFEYKDEDAKQFKDSLAQFGDLHLRMQALTHQIAEVQRVTGEIAYTVGHAVEMINDLTGHDNHNKLGFNLKNLDDRINGLDRTVQNLERSLRHEGEKIQQLKDHHENLPGHLKEAITTHGPRMGFSISLLVVFQIMLAIAYVFYKRRKGMAPKKYL
ncbi:hypothetical protein H072_7968 [Dactylellina haptotyla CBS 200.50]|uniref:L-type lectin-like domain-containing protein n=1 Tax=Dactylellina haptotyla (strain CBS 200.50) TaxID=1284197 RepID=S8BSH4_DACHA|nr:hypothetical protein H072_7968 [Dactylellina haptotyla CBS 200.50]